MINAPYEFRKDGSSLNTFAVRSHGNIVEVQVPDGRLTVGSALLMAGALMRSALCSALTYGDGVTEEYLVKALNEGGDFPSWKAQNLLHLLHSEDRRNDYNRGHADGYDIGFKHGYDQ